MASTTIHIILNINMIKKIKPEEEKNENEKLEVTIGQLIMELLWNRVTIFTFVSFMAYDMNSLVIQAKYTAVDVMFFMLTELFLLMTRNGNFYFLHGIA